MFFFKKQSAKSINYNEKIDKCDYIKIKTVINRYHKESEKMSHRVGAYILITYSCQNKERALSNQLVKKTAH